MGHIKKIERVEGIKSGLGYIIYTSRILFNQEQEQIKNELKRISAEKINFTFFRVEAGR